MGVLYTVWPLDSQMKEWLTSEGIEFPEAPSRWPTKAEVRNVLGSLSGFNVRYTDNGPNARWDATIESPEVETLWTLLHADPEDTSDSSTHVGFEKGEPALIIAILRDLSSSTGPLALMADVGGPPLVVSWKYSFQSLVDSFYTLDQESNVWKQLILVAPGATESH